MTMTDVVWNQSRYDSGVYDCKVVRNGDHGLLTVTLLGLVDHLLHSETVNCDRADTDKWRSRSAAVIANPDLRSIEPQRLHGDTRLAGHA